MSFEDAVQWILRLVFPSNSTSWLGARSSILLSIAIELISNIVSTRLRRLCFVILNFSIFPSERYDYCAVSTGGYVKRHFRNYFAFVPQFEKLLHAHLVRADAFFFTTTATAYRKCDFRACEFVDRIE